MPSHACCAGAPDFRVTPVSFLNHRSRKARQARDLTTKLRSAVIEITQDAIHRIFKAVVLSDKVGVVVATPVPLRETVEVAPVVELLLMVRLPVADPAVFGEKPTCTVSD